VWAGKNNIGDMSGNDWMRSSTRARSARRASQRRQAAVLPGLDAMVVVDVRKNNVDGTANRDYGKVVNFVQGPPLRVEGEPHHMQYGVAAGPADRGVHLFTDLTDLERQRHPQRQRWKNVIRPEETPREPSRRLRLPGDLAIGTYMAAPT